VYEIYGGEDAPPERANLGTLLRELVAIARAVGNYQALFDKALQDQLKAQAQATIVGVS
jgi:hypothetical protein